MTVSRRSALAAGLGVIPAAATLRALGQDRRPRAPAGGLDVMLAPWLLADGYRQIQVSQLAIKRASSRAVKDFARAEVREHEGLKAILADMGFRPPVSAAPRRAPDAAPARSPGGLRRATPPARPTADDNARPDAATTGATVPGVPPAVVVVGSLKQELAEQCVASLRQELGKKDGEAFDRAYLADQLAAHYELLDTVVVFKRHAGVELRRTLATTAQPIIEKHIARLGEIMAALQARSGKGAANE